MIARHFSIQELVPPEIYESRGERAWQLMDTRILEAADEIRDDFGILVVNDWNSGGHYRYSGFRPADCSTGAPLSQHRYGRALDIKPRQAGLREVYDAIVSGHYPHITTVENIEHTPTWIHIDCRSSESDSIRVINP